MSACYHEHDVVVVRLLLQSTRYVTGTTGVVRQPRIGDAGAVVHILDDAHCTVECVDSSGRTCWLADFHVDELTPELADWTFDVHEVSAGVYRGVGRGPQRMSVESTDTDPDKVLADCRTFALRFSGEAT
jgi:hypothetical protein